MTLKKKQVMQLDFQALHFVLAFHSVFKECAGDFVEPTEEAFSCGASRDGSRKIDCLNYIELK